MKDTRRAEMENFISQRQRVSMQELCDTFAVSMNTIRTDVAALVKAGIVEKVYGGVQIRRHSDVPLFKTRSLLRTEVKRRLARAAAAEILDGDILFIDSGTTTMYLLDYLDENCRITVVTPSVPVIQRALELPNVELVVLPGLYNRRTNAMMDGGTAEYLAQYQHTKAFLGVSSIAPDGALGVSSYPEHEVKRTALERSLRRYLLADSSKYGEAALLPYGQVSQCDCVFTDTDMPQAFLSLCEASDTAVCMV